MYVDAAVKNLGFGGTSLTRSASQVKDTVPMGKELHNRKCPSVPLNASLPEEREVRTRNTVPVRNQGASNPRERAVPILLKELFTIMENSFSLTVVCPRLFCFSSLNNYGSYLMTEYAQSR